MKGREISRTRHPFREEGIVVSPPPNAGEKTGMARGPTKYIETKN